MVAGLEMVFLSFLYFSITFPLSGMQLVFQQSGLLFCFFFCSVLGHVKGILSSFVLFLFFLQLSFRVLDWPGLAGAHSLFCRDGMVVIPLFKRSWHESRGQNACAKGVRDLHLCIACIGTGRGNGGMGTGSMVKEAWKSGAYGHIVGVGDEQACNGDELCNGVAGCNGVIHDVLLVFTFVTATYA